MKMLGKKMESVKKLAKKVTVISRGRQHQHHECLLCNCGEPSLAKTPTGFFAVYVGEERQSIVVVLAAARSTASSGCVYGNETCAPLCVRQLGIAAIPIYTSAR
ncbi:hypothetical protein HHK36_019345 [Tetracentron sinense]|uniref:Uncharacterized protein n=1 Tax=Tetracentron sinense TaxID=13715 RepID=A0A834YTQ7_TETSI|nr:hypothetical protein HHK36_019345 [Tetracentron sinense]